MKFHASLMVVVKGFTKMGMVNCKLAKKASTNIDLTEF